MEVPALLKRVCVSGRHFNSSTFDGQLGFSNHEEVARCALFFEVECAEAFASEAVSVMKAVLVPRA